MHTRSLLATAAVGLVALVAPAAGLAGGQPSPQDITWMRTSAGGDHFEIVAGKLAQRHGASAVVRRLGARLVKDHSRSLGELRSTARRLAVRLPGTPTPTEQWELAVLRTLTGRNFDAWYTQLEIKDHHQDIEETAFESAKGQDALVTKLAAQDLPMLRTHLRLSMAGRAAG
jgi:putative membrane protein